MAVLLSFLTHNYIAVMILLSFSLTIIVNKRLAVPATNYFAAGIITLFLIIFVDTVIFNLEENAIFSTAPDRQYKLLIIMTALDFILRPLVIMILSFIVIPNKKRLPLFAIPAIVNAVVYISSCFGETAAQLVDKSSIWHRSVIGMTVYYTEIFYLFLLMMFSIIYFKWDELKRSVIVLVIGLQFILVTVLEGIGVLREYTNAILALGMLEYYFYLSVVYQHEINESIMLKELTIAQQKISLLRTQMHPHFIINVLSIIRSLVKRDTQRAVQCIDAFSDYLKVHIRAIQTDELIDFDNELRHVKAYLSLVQADRSRQIDVLYDLKATDFTLPPLSLEPIVENAVKYGTGKENGVIVISTQESDNFVSICVADNGTGNPEQNKQVKSTGIGISNTRQRLAIQCGGTLETKQTDGGMLVTITIPKQEEVSV